jgi:hypothetical protein
MRSSRRRRSGDLQQSILQTKREGPRSTSHRMVRRRTGSYNPIFCARCLPSNFAMCLTSCLLRVQSSLPAVRYSKWRVHGSTLSQMAQRHWRYAARRRRSRLARAVCEADETLSFRAYSLLVSTTSCRSQYTCREWVRTRSSDSPPWTASMGR